jgi:hypothetical protein
MNPINSSNPELENEELYLSQCKFQYFEELLKNVRVFYSTKGHGLYVRNLKKISFSNVTVVVTIEIHDMYQKISKKEVLRVV